MLVKLLKNAKLYFIYFRSFKILTAIPFIYLFSKILHILTNVYYYIRTTKLSL